MEAKKEFEKLIARLLSNELTAKEESAFLEQIKECDEKNKFFEDLESIWRLAGLKPPASDSQIEVELAKFKEAIANTSGKVIPITVLQNVDAEPSEPAAGKRFSYLFRSVSIAASVLLAIGLGFVFFYPKNGGRGIVEEKALVTVAATSVRHEINNTGALKHLRLEDGSDVILFDKSEISYSQPFTQKRDVVLKGKASFKVAKDKSKPFTVTTGDITTTALGTEFTITAYPNSETARVHLVEGKVVVKSSSAAEKRLEKEYYLIPGQVLLYTRRTVTARVFNHKAPKILSKPVSNPDEPQFSDTEAGPWFMFNNQPLANVLDQLSILYNVKITYSKKDIKNVRFIGKFNDKDSLENIIHHIAILNDLKVDKQKNKFRLYK